MSDTLLITYGRDSMTEVNIDLKAKDQMSSVLDHVTQRLGIFNKQGLAMGISFAGINIGMQLAQQAIQGLTQYIQDGVEANRNFEASLARLTTSSNEFASSISNVKENLINFSYVFATDVNTLSGGLREFIRDGYNATDATTMLWKAERFAIASGNDLATTQDVLVRALHAFNLDASDLTGVINELNGITSITGMTLGDIDQILGRVAIAAQASGIGFEDLINLMYTLHETGTSNRFLASELTKQLGDLSKVKIEPMPANAAISVEEKFKTIGGTVQFTVAQVKELNKQFQMRLTASMDIGAYFDKGTVSIARALATATELKQKLPDAYTSLSEAANASPIGALLYGQRVSDIEALANAYVEYDTQLKEATKDEADSTKTLPDIKAKLDVLTASLETQNATLATYSQKIGDLTEMRTFTIDMRNATLAVQAQQDAIKQLQRISDSYNLSLMKNSLEIMKIQYGADTRHGLDRTQKERIAELERTNAGIQIKEQENQIAVAEIRTNGLQSAQDKLDQIQRGHDEAMYNQQIRDLDANIKAQNELYSSLVTAIATTNKNIEIQQKAWQENQLVMTVHWAKEMRDQMNYAYGANAPPKTQAEQSGTQPAVPNPPGWRSKTPFWKYQHGGIVQETAAALVHKGELIIPKNMVDSMRNGNGVATSSSGGGSVSHNITITVNAEVRKDVDVEDWGKKLGAGLASGFLEGTSSGTTTATSRKTGVSVIVPGTTTTIRTGRVGAITTLPILQPLKNKGRFRVG